MPIIKFIDLFAGIGGIRKGFEQAAIEKGFTPKCIFTSEIKDSAIKILKENHPNDEITGDITKVNPNSIPDFDILLGGFPCQAFSSAGRRQGFNDTRGTLFFNVANILKTKKPFGFVLENVEGLVNHDKKHAKPGDNVGRTLRVILNTLTQLGYKVSWKVLNAKDYGVPQKRRRIYIVGTKLSYPNLDNFKKTESKLSEILEHGLPTKKTIFTERLLSLFSLEQLNGKAIKDKRGGKNNIHSWDLELKGKVTKRQKNLLNIMLHKRRNHEWAKIYKLDWMDGMPLTLDMIRTFWKEPGLEKDLSYLVSRKYLRYEYPKKKIDDDNGASHRVPDTTKEMGYNLVAGKKSFEVNQILDPNGFAPTLVAMDMEGLYVEDGPGIRPLSLREGLRLFGFPDDFIFDISIPEGRDLLGNTVVVPVIKLVSSSILDIYQRANYETNTKTSLR